MLEDRFAESLGQTWAALFGAGRLRPAPPFEPAWQKLARLPGDYRVRAGWAFEVLLESFCGNWIPRDL